MNNGCEKNGSGGRVAGENSRVRAEPSIFRLGGKDAVTLAALERLCFSTFWSAERYHALFASAASVTTRFADLSAFGLRDAAEELTAFLVVGVTPYELEIYNIAVRPDLRHTGLGKRLLAGVLELARTDGIGRAVLEVRAGNAPALGLYRSSGFVQCGRRAAYYADTGEDALVLCREAASVNMGEQR